MKMNYFNLPLCFFRVYLNDLKMVELTRNFNDNGSMQKEFCQFSPVIDIDHWCVYLAKFPPHTSLCLHLLTQTLFMLAVLGEGLV